MASATLIAALTLAALVSLSAVEGWAWLKMESGLTRIGWLLAWLATGLLIINLIGWGLARRHIPPVSLDEVLIALTMAILLIYLGLKANFRSPGASFCLGLPATLLLAAWAYWFWPGTPQLGREPLWLWGLLARWVLITGIAGLYWLALLSGLSWRRDPYLQQTLLFETEPALTLSKQLLSAVLLIFFLGGLMVMGRAWWGWGQPAGQNLILVVVFLLLLAAWWLRFTWPQRRWWTWSLIILAFVAALPALTVI